MMTSGQFILIFYFVICLAVSSNRLFIQKSMTPNLHDDEEMEKKSATID